MKHILNINNLLRVGIVLLTAAASVAQVSNGNTSKEDAQQLFSGPIGAERTGTPAHEIPPAAGPGYLIGPQDVLTVHVWHEPDFSAESLPVRPDGKISLPLLNDIQAAGFTPVQLSQEITLGLKKYVSDPQVTVVINAINSERIYVMGQVARPGAYPLLPDMTVLQALSGAGGFQQYAKSKNTYVLRGSQRIPFNYKEAIKGKDSAHALILQSGDTLVVP